jgi:hypothetical protein
MVEARITLPANKNNTLKKLKKSPLLRQKPQSTGALWGFYTYIQYNQLHEKHVNSGQRPKN